LGVVFSLELELELSGVKTNGSDRPAVEGIFFGVVDSPGPREGEEEEDAAEGMEKRLLGFRIPDEGSFGSGKSGIGGIDERVLEDVDGVG
jgi:hypothetical protein